MVIGWDLDGVLYPWHEHMLQFAKDELGKPKDMSLEELFGPDGDFHKWPQTLRDSALRIPTLYEKSPILPTKLEILTRLSKNHTFYYITLRPEEVWFTTERWVDRNNLPYKENLFCVKDGKRDLVSTLKINYYIEDRPAIVKELNDITKVIILTRPWNYTYEQPENVIRIENFDDVERIVE